MLPVFTQVMLPGLRCLLGDLKVVSPDHVGVVSSMIREFEDRLQDSSTTGGGGGVGGGYGLPGKGRAGTSAASGGMASSTTSDAVGSSVALGGEAMKSKVLSRFKDVKDRASHSNFSKMFAGGKK